MGARVACTEMKDNSTHVFLLATSCKCVYSTLRVRKFGQWVGHGYCQRGPDRVFGGRGSVWVVWVGGLRGWAGERWSALAGCFAPLSLAHAHLYIRLFPSPAGENGLLVDQRFLPRIVEGEVRGGGRAL